jgi:hypothetical protein
MIDLSNSKANTICLVLFVFTFDETSKDSVLKENFYHNIESKWE